MWSCHQRSTKATERPHPLQRFMIDGAQQAQHLDGEPMGMKSPHHLVGWGGKYLSLCHTRGNTTRGLAFVTLILRRMHELIRMDE